MQKVSRHVLEKNGATFATRDEDFLVGKDTDRDFHPTDVFEDADGSLLVIDTGGWYKLCCPSSQLVKADVLGAIYRIRRTGAPKVDDPRGLKLAWSEMSAEDLVSLLGDPRPAVRRRAVNVLGKKGRRRRPGAGGGRPLRAFGRGPQERRLGRDEDRPRRRPRGRPDGPGRCR